jgi:hypothetical protein
LVKSGATKPAQRIDGIYALLLVAKIAAVDVGSGGSTEIYMWCASLSSLILYTHVCQVCLSSTIVAVFWTLLSLPIYFLQPLFLVVVWTSGHFEVAQGGAREIVYCSLLMCWVVHRWHAHEREDMEHCVAERFSATLSFFGKFFFKKNRNPQDCTFVFTLLSLLSR